MLRLFFPVVLLVTSGAQAASNTSVSKFVLAVQVACMAINSDGSLNQEACLESNGQPPATVHLTLEAPLKEIRCNGCPPGRYGEVTQKIETTVNGDKIQLWVRTGLRQVDKHLDENGKLSPKRVALNLALSGPSEAGQQTAIVLKNEEAVYAIFADAPPQKFDRESGLKIEYRPYVILSKVRTTRK